MGTFLAGPGVLIETGLDVLHQGLLVWLFRSVFLVEPVHGRGDAISNGLRLVQGRALGHQYSRL